MEINEVKKCSKCGLRKAQDQFKGICRVCYESNKAKGPFAPPEGTITVKDFIDRQTSPMLGDLDISKVKSKEDWVKLAESLAPTYRGIADGTVRATAAQARILTIIWDRAYGRATKSQEDQTGATGIIVLPRVGGGEYTSVCPNCHSKYDKLTLLQWIGFLKENGKRIKLSYGGDYGASDVAGSSGQIDGDFPSPSPGLQIEATVDGDDAEDAEVNERGN